MRITIKRVDPKNMRVAQDIRRLQKMCLPGDRPYDMRKGTWWLAYQDKTAIAFAAMAHSAQWVSTGYLCRAGVMRLFRGKGLQKRLISVRERYARCVGYTHLITDTRDNPASSNSLIARGFKIYQPTKPWGWSNAIYWIKKL